MPPTDSLRRAMEAALVANPDDLATHMAYADHLQEQGDPRGEFIQVQLALEDPKLPPKERKRLAEREEELLDLHQAEWLGEVAPLFLLKDKELEAAGATFGMELYWHRFELRFRRGWVDAIRLGGFSPDFANALNRCSLLRLLRELAITSAAYDDPAYEELAAWECLDCVRRFQVGPDDDQCHISGQGIAPAVARMKRLEELLLYAHGVEVGEIFALPMPNLRTLHAYHLHEYRLDVLAANPSLGNLVTLSCFPHAREPDDDDAYIDLEQFVALVRSPHLKSLSWLHLQATDIGDEGCRALVASGMLRRLRVLDLNHGRISDEGALALAACPDVRRLEKLNLANNQLTARGIAALKATGAKEVIADEQFSAAAIEEGEYLWYGDCE